VDQTDDYHGTLIILLTNTSLFLLAIITQTINAISLPLVCYFLIHLTSDNSLMGEYANNRFQKYFSTVFTLIIVLASGFTVATVFFQ